MSLMKWFRKNNKKLMAVVVIVLMFVFVGSAWLSRLGRTRPTARKSAMAYYGKKHKITNYDLATARAELEMLRMLGADVLIRPQPLQFAPTQDFRVVLLGELLFAEQSSGAQTSKRIKQMAIRSGYQITNEQIDALYRKTYPPPMYWLLLRDEARAAGLRLDNDQMRNQLAAIVPRLQKGRAYPDVINSIMKWQGISEEQILTTFGNLLSVIEYAKIMCSTEDLTLRQLRQSAKFSQEKMNVEYVRFEPGMFTKDLPEPGENEIAEQFDKYKRFFAGELTEDNPHGFGYKLDDSVQLEYIAVRLDDAAAVVDKPTDEEAEEYYQRNRSRLVEQVPSDPNDPNSPVQQRTKSFAEVAELILKTLMEKKVNTKAEQIIRDAKTLTGSALDASGIDSTDLTAEKFRQLAGDYKPAADELAKKYGVPVHTGKTGMLSAAVMQADPCLAMLYARAGNVSRTSLVRLVFAIDELADSNLGPFDVSKPRMYETIGPLTDLRAQYSGYSGKITALVRATAAQKARVPDSVDYTSSIATIKLDKAESEQDRYSVKEKVINDLKKLATVDTTRKKARQFIKYADANGWAGAVDEFNKSYAPGEPNAAGGRQATLRLMNTALTRISDIDLQTVTVRNEGDPMARTFINRRTLESRLTEKLYSLLPPDSNSLETVPTIIEFAPGMSFYCIKNLNIERLYRRDYDRIRAQLAYAEDFRRSQVLAAVHYNPENILKRMNFRLVPPRGSAPPAEAEEQARAETPSERADRDGENSL